MRKEERNNLLQELKDVLRKEKNDGFKNLDKIRNLFLIIHRLDSHDRKHFESFYHQINEELFQENLKLKEYQPDRFFSSEKKKSGGKEKASQKNKKQKFQNSLTKLVKAIRNSFDLINRHCFIRLESDTNVNDYKLLLLFDGKSEPHIFKKIKNNLEDIECETSSFDEFIQRLDTLHKFNYICLYVFNPRTEPDDDIKENFKELSSYYGEENVSQIKILNDKLQTSEDYLVEKNISNIEEEICYLMKIDLNNLELTHQEIKVLKKVFKDNRCYAIQYKNIKKGFSGAKVIKVIPNTFGPKPINYIIKIREKNDSKKLENELKAFKEYVDIRDQSYVCENIETENCYAIKYRYAQSQDASESYSFGDVIEGNSNLADDIKANLISKLFDEKIYQSWNAERVEEKISFPRYYENFIDFSEILEKFSTVKNLTKEEAEKDPLMDNFQSLKNYQFTSSIKPCHGDLHTENFFIDNLENIFLIDFGDTGIHHAVIDHAMLEASIKLNHIPYYIKDEVLFRIEEELIDEQSFNKDYVLKSTDRSDLKTIYQYIFALRNSVEEYIINDCNEYFYSLFMITFRQIQYPDLNQLYAIKSSELLSEYLISTLNL